MSYKQLVQPNLNVVGTVGMCLKYAHEMFGAPGGVLYAWQAWENAKYKHPASEPLPTDVDVLLWYSYKGNEGHVTANIIGRGIYSSPYQAGTTHAVLPSIAEVERIYGVQYVGWSEDINGVRVCEPVAPPAPVNTPAPNTGLITRHGTAVVTVPDLHVRAAPSIASAVVANYASGESFNYDSYIVTDGYVWLSYVSNSGARHYVAEGPDDGNELNVWVKGGV